MRPKSEELEQRIGQLRARLRRAGVKMTPQRLEIFREVARSVEHPDAETVCRRVRNRLPMVSLDTVYRTLWLLLDLGLINTLDPPRQRLRFDGNTSSHHHFVCVKCGMARDFWGKEFDKPEIPDAVKNLGSVERVRVQVTGVCLRCSAKADRKNRALRKGNET
jgi:Fur family transcriptional regulator, peroxide stress response regulator